MTATEYVLPRGSRALGANETTPLAGLNADVPATATPFLSTLKDAVEARTRVAVIAAAGSTFVAPAVGVEAVIEGLASVANDHVPPETACPSAVRATEYVLPRCSAVDGWNVTTPETPSNTEDPATGDPSVVMDSSAVDACETVALTACVVGTFAASADGVDAVSAGGGGTGCVAPPPNVTSASTKYAVAFHDEVGKPPSAP